ncbi:Thiol:disulfide interchange protein DsbA [Duganella sacchari]|uniref:Thiol:disulfide interchange protein n=1 Tax=Duganella sacchari TaxID=551987 RepID=A0A1M7R1A7_9BURK|nr:thiol:disulfide interchange protein DsbA/DsbL [Duganella sacchari]SHN38294.1 Thiol:disulfide interchange protein DsbA [Duganella sacchari]
MRLLSFLRPLIATVAFMAAAAGAADFKDGLDYNTVNAPRPDTGKKVEVLEFFMYHCPHCNALDPSLSDWVKKNSDKIVFKRMHMGDDPQAKAFYTLEAMNLMNNAMHEKIFHAIHKERNRLNTDQALLDFLVKNGVDKAKYLEAFNSFGVQTKLKRAQQVAAQYKLDSVPALVIDGHYTTSPAVAGHGLTDPDAAHVAMFKVVDSLVAKSLQERAGKK